MHNEVLKYLNVQWRTCCLLFATVNLLFALRWGSPRLTLRAGWPPGETTFGENVATTLLTPLAEVEADTFFSPTLMVVLTALACEYAGHVPVSPLQLLCGLGRRLMSFPRQCIRGIHRFHCLLH